MRTSVLLAALIIFPLSHSFSQTNEYTFKWAKQFAGKNETDATAMALDKSGNIYVTGRTDFQHYQSIGTHGWTHKGGKIFLAKLDHSGNLLWMQKYGGGTDDHGIGNGVAVDNSGNIYVIGTIIGAIHFGDTVLTAKGRPDMFLAKYDASGKLLWIKQSGGKDCYCVSHGIALDTKGNIFITGEFCGNATFGNKWMTSRSGITDHSSDFFLVKYDPSGNVLWTKQAGDSEENTGHGIATDVAGNVYVTGRFSGVQGGYIEGRGYRLSISFDDKQINQMEKIKNTDIGENCLFNFIVKYDNDGKVQWAKPTAGHSTYGTLDTIAIDKMGHIYVAGSLNFPLKVDGISLTNTSDGCDEIFLLSYDANGKVLWGRTAGGKAHDNCLCVAADESGNAYIGGYYSEDARFGPIEVKASLHDPEISYSPAFVARYSPDGSVAWVKNIDVGNDYVPVENIVTDQMGNAYVIGSFSKPVHFDSITLEPTKNFWGSSIGSIFVAKLGQ